MKSSISMVTPRLMKSILIVSSSNLTKVLCQISHASTSKTKNPKCSKHFNSPTILIWAKTKWCRPHTSITITTMRSSRLPSTAGSNALQQWTANPPNYNLDSNLSNHLSPTWLATHQLSLHRSMLHNNNLLFKLQCCKKPFHLWWTFWPRSHLCLMLLLCKEKTLRIATEIPQMISLIRLKIIQILLAPIESWSMRFWKSNPPKRVISAESSGCETSWKRRQY